jgi:hypothetical protein
VRRLHLLETNSLHVLNAAAGLALHTRPPMFLTSPSPCHELPRPDAYHMPTSPWQPAPPVQGMAATHVSSPHTIAPPGVMQSQSPWVPWVQAIPGDHPSFAFPTPSPYRTSYAGVHCPTEYQARCVESSDAGLNAQFSLPLSENGNYPAPMLVTSGSEHAYHPTPWRWNNS